jgi:opacity protein-like surface antigen
MKKVIMAAGMAALLASPALAQSYNPTYGTGNAALAPLTWTATGDVTGSAGALAYSTARTRAQSLRGVRAQAAPSAVTAGAYVDGRDVGTDPDANIRFQLLRDPPGRD